MFPLKQPTPPQTRSIKVLSSSSSGDFLRLKSHGQKYDFVYSNWPTYFFSRAVGLMPFSIVLSSNGRIQRARVGMYDLIWFVISVSWYILLAFVSYLDLKLPQNPNESFILKLGDHLLLIYGLCHGAFMILMDMYNRRKIVELAQKCFAFDREVSFM